MNEKEKVTFSIKILKEKRINFSNEAELQNLKNPEYMEHSIVIMRWLANIIQAAGLERHQVPSFLQWLKQNQQFENIIGDYVNLYILIY